MGKSSMLLAAERLQCTVEMINERDNGLECMYTHKEGAYDHTNIA